MQLRACPTEQWQAFNEELGRCELEELMPVCGGARPSAPSNDTAEATTPYTPPIICSL